MSSLGASCRQAATGQGAYNQGPTHSRTKERAVPVVTLDAFELRSAAFLGMERQHENLLKGRKDFYGAQKENGWQMHIEGACGEAALAKYMNCYWSIGKLRDDDVGDLQVRTRSKDWYELILHPNDPDDKIFVLLTGTAPSYRLVGWIKASDGKIQKYWKDPAKGRPAFFVPQQALRPMSELANGGVQ